MPVRRLLASSDLTLVPVLDPETLDVEAAEAVQKLLDAGNSANTQRSYATALRYWAAWFRLRYGAALTLPISAATVLQFLADHAQRPDIKGMLAHQLPEAIDAALVRGGFKSALGPPKLSTLLHRIAVLSKAHTAKTLANPTRDPLVQELLRKIRRAYAQRGALKRSKRALTREPFDALVDTCLDDLAGIRDRSILYFGFSSGGRRRIEIATAVVENLTALEDGSYVYRMSHSKAAQTGEDANADKPLVGKAAAALARWLAISGIQSGPLFRRIRGSKVAEPLAGQAVWLIVKRRARLAGLRAEDFGAHSLRSGFVTEAGRQNVNAAEAQALTGHRSLQTFMSYYQMGAVTQSRAASLLEDSEES